MKRQGAPFWVVWLREVVVGGQEAGGMGRRGGGGGGGGARKTVQGVGVGGGVLREEKA